MTQLVHVSFVVLKYFSLLRVYVGCQRDFLASFDIFIHKTLNFQIGIDQVKQYFITDTVRNSPGVQAVQLHK